MSALLVGHGVPHLTPGVWNSVDLIETGPRVWRDYSGKRLAAYAAVKGLNDYRLESR